MLRDLDGFEQDWPEWQDCAGVDNLSPTGAGTVTMCLAGAKMQRTRLCRHHGFGVTGMRAFLSAAFSLMAVIAANTSAARAQWVTPQDYSYTQLSLCPQSYARYQACDDQMATFTAAVTTAREKKRKLLVVFGADWCPWCRTIDTNLPTADYLGHPDLKDRIDVVKIALNVLKEGRKVIVPSGQAVQDLVAKHILFDKPEGYIPFYAVINPDNSTVAVGLANGRFADVINDKPANIPADFRRSMSAAMLVLGIIVPPK
jgi:thiol-disulfide isomerase/thioredoxin